MLLEVSSLAPLRNTIKSDGSPVVVNACSKPSTSPNVSTDAQTTKAGSQAGHQRGHPANAKITKVVLQWNHVKSPAADPSTTDN